MYRDKELRGIKKRSEYLSEVIAGGAKECVARIEKSMTYYWNPQYHVKVWNPDIIVNGQEFEQQQNFPIEVGDVFYLIREEDDFVYLLCREIQYVQRVTKRQYADCFKDRLGS